MDVNNIKETAEKLVDALGIVADGVLQLLDAVESDESKKAKIKRIRDIMADVHTDPIYKKPEEEMNDGTE